MKIHVDNIVDESTIAEDFFQSSVLNDGNLNDGDEREFNSDSEYDMEEDGDDDPYYQYDDESYYPFPSKLFALLYILVNSPHPLGEKNLLLIWYILGQMGLRVPSLASIKSFKLPDMKPPVRHESGDGVPFYRIPISTVIQQIMGRDDIAGSLVRYPVIGHAEYTAFQQDYTTQVYAQLEVLVNLVQFKYLVPDTAIVHLDRDTLILYENIVIPVSSISGCVTFPNSIIKWMPPASFSRFSHEELEMYHAPHPMKAKSLGKPVYILPFVLFADDTSGNKSKKWHKFISWYLKFPDNLSALELAKPMAEELFMLETQGLEVYDAQSKQMVLVVAPLICIVADNPMSSELLNHLRGAANKYCRICEVDRTQDPSLICAKRTREVSLQQMAKISSQPTEVAKATLRTQSTPVEDLHVMSYGMCKYLLKEQMPLMSARQNFESFNSQLNGDRGIYQPGAARKAIQHSATTLQHLTLHSGPRNQGVQSIESLMQLQTPYEFMSPLDLTQRVTAYRAVMSQVRCLVNCGDYVELSVPVEQVKYASLSAVFRASNGATYCVLQGLLPLQSIDGEQLHNAFDCPILELTRKLFIVPSADIQRPVNIVHECTDSCTFSEVATTLSVEREQLVSTKLTYIHDWDNPYYCYNIFCV
eukprot:Em0027g64a